MHFPNEALLYFRSLYDIYTEINLEQIKIYFN